MKKSSPKNNANNPKLDIEPELFNHRSDQLLETIYELLNEKDYATIKKLISPLYAADVADIIESLPTLEREQLIDTLKPNLDPEVLTHLEDYIRTQVVEWLGIKYLAKALMAVDSDDALAIIESLSAKHQHSILSVIPKQARNLFEQALSLPEDSAGRLMQQEIVVVPPFWTVEHIQQHLQKNKDLPSRFLDIFVINPKNQLIGCIPLDSLLKASPSTKASSLINEHQQTIPVLADKKEVAQFFHHYNLVSAPVIDEKKMLLGVITADDILEVLEEETEKEIFHIAGVGDSDIFAPVFKIFYSRIGWLMVGFLNVLISVFVLSQFIESFEEMAALAVLLPVVGTMGGNAGTQITTITIRALGVGSLKKFNSSRSLGKEIMVSILNSFLFGTLLIGLAIAYSDNLVLGLILASAMTFTLLWAAFAGVMLPILIERLKFDPAIASGPLITASIDVVGYVLFLGMATFILLG